MKGWHRARFDKNLENSPQDSMLWFSNEGGRLFYFKYWRAQMRLDGNLKEEEALEGGKSRWRGGGECMWADSHKKHTHTNRQRSYSQPRHPILSQTGGKMLYFPSKLKCQLILMWKAKSARHTMREHTQTAFTLAGASAEFQMSPGPAAIGWWSCGGVGKRGGGGSQRDVRASLIRPNVAFHPSCHMKVISKLRCSRVYVWLF